MAAVLVEVVPLDSAVRSRPIADNSRNVADCVTVQGTCRQSPALCFLQYNNLLDRADSPSVVRIMVLPLHELLPGGGGGRH
eukprot:2595798-Rhodomonas_salina.1